MALLRVVHASELPDPASLMEKLSSGETVPARAPASAPSESAQRPLMQLPPSFEALIELLERGGQVRLGQQLHDYASLVSYAPPELVVSPRGPIAARDLEAALKTLTGQSWKVRTQEEGGQPTLREREIAAKRAEEQEVRETPQVKAALEAFPAAELEGYRLDEQRSA
jgi:DNA polymerase III subunit gamma/tau